MTVMEERFELASQRILEIEKEKRMPEQFQRYFAENADYLGVLLEEYKWIASGAMREASLQELEKEIIWTSALLHDVEKRSTSVDEGMKTKQAVNPYLPSWEYVPDAEPHIVDGRVYIFGWAYCYVC